MATNSRPLAAAEPDRLDTCDGAAEALDLMARALALLDAMGAPADAGAYIDHAMHRLREWTGDAVR